MVSYGVIEYTDSIDLCMTYDSTVGGEASRRESLSPPLLCYWTAAVLRTGQRDQQDNPGGHKEVHDSCMHLFAGVTSTDSYAIDVH